MNQNELDNNPSLPRPDIKVSIAYDEYQRNKIWKEITELKNIENSPYAFAVTIRNLYFNDFQFASSAPNKHGAKDLSFTILSQSRLRKIYKSIDEKENIKNTFRITTWRFFDIIATIIRRNALSNLDPSYFDAFNIHQCKSVHEVLGEKDKIFKYFMRPSNPSSDFSACVLHINKSEDDLHSNITLWVGKSSDATLEQLHFDISNNIYDKYTQWDGIARYKPLNIIDNSSEGLFNNHSMIAILRNYMDHRPNVLNIKRGLKTKSVTMYDSLLDVTYGHISYEISEI